MDIIYLVLYIHIIMSLHQIYGLIHTLSSRELTSTTDIWFNTYTLIVMSRYLHQISGSIHTLRRSELEAGSIWSSIRMISGVSMLTVIDISLVGGGGGGTLDGVATVNQ